MCDANLLNRRSFGRVQRGKPVKQCVDGGSECIWNEVGGLRGSSVLKLGRYGLECNRGRPIFLSICGCSRRRKGPCKQVLITLSRESSFGGRVGVQAIDNIEKLVLGNADWDIRDPECELIQLGCRADCILHGEFYPWGWNS